MQKIIITSYVNEPDDKTVLRVLKVIEQGLISERKSGKCYCFATSWKDGTVVYAQKTKSGHRFIVNNATTSNEKV
jgi:hypothetical protein